VPHLSNTRETADYVAAVLLASGKFRRVAVQHPEDPTQTSSVLVTGASGRRFRLEAQPLPNGPQTPRQGR
jgi:hypothetical protein